MKNRAAIVGIGETEYRKWGQIADRTEFHLAIEAILHAVVGRLDVGDLLLTGRLADVDSQRARVVDQAPSVNVGEVVEVLNLVGVGDQVHRRHHTFVQRAQELQSAEAVPVSREQHDVEEVIRCLMREKEHDGLQGLRLVGHGRSAAYEGQLKRVLEARQSSAERGVAALELLQFLAIRDPIQRVFAHRAASSSPADALRRESCYRRRSFKSGVGRH